ncbi:hypothetical protein MY1884_003214 [Beauveria asiatica]
MKPWQNPHRQSNHQKFRFEHLPAELKLIIIKAALPEQRIFHVSGRWMDEYEPKKTGADTYGFTFYYRHPPLTLLSVCPAMRAAVLQCGVFLDSLRGARGAFFVPTIDMLYLDERHARCYIGRWHGGSTDADATRWAAIRHVGIWCEDLYPACSWDLIEKVVPFIEPSVKWGPVLATMCIRMPVLQSITFMVPMDVWTTDKLPRLDGLTYVLPKSRDPGGWRRILGRRYTMEWSHTEEQRPRSPRRNWCRCRRTWMCPVTYFEP